MIPLSRNWNHTHPQVPPSHEETPISVMSDGNRHDQEKKKKKEGKKKKVKNWEPRNPRHSRLNPLTQKKRMFALEKTRENGGNSLGPWRSGRNGGPRNMNCDVQTSQHYCWDKERVGEGRPLSYPSWRVQLDADAEYVRCMHNLYLQREVISRAKYYCRSFVIKKNFCPGRKNFSLKLYQDPKVMLN